MNLVPNFASHNTWIAILVFGAIAVGIILLLKQNEVQPDIRPVRNLPTIDPRYRVQAPGAEIVEPEGRRDITPPERTPIAPECPAFRIDLSEKQGGRHPVTKSG